jgi:RHS repeat-associated protein
MTLDYDGAKTAELRYKAYGETRYTWGTTPTEYRFTGQKQELSLGLYQMGARWYDPYINRFISPDSIIPDPANPQNLNRYAYVNNNPLRFRDPTGHQGECSWWDVACWAKHTANKISNVVREWWLYHNPCGMSVDPMCQMFSFSAPEVEGLQQPISVSGGEAERLRQMGRWLEKAESMSEAAQAYQRFISGRSDDLVFQLEEGTRTFDGFDDQRGVLLEAKRIPDNFVDPTTGQFDTSWVSKTDDWVNQARGQVEAAGGAPIEWHFHTEAARDAMYYLFAQEDPGLLDYIKLIWTPEP